MPLFSRTFKVGLMGTTSSSALQRLEKAFLWDVTLLPSFLSLYDTIKIECIILHWSVFDTSWVGRKQKKRYHWSTACPDFPARWFQVHQSMQWAASCYPSRMFCLGAGREKIVWTSHEDESCTCLKLCSTVLACMWSWPSHAATSVWCSALSLAWHCKPQEASLRERWSRQSNLCSDSIIAVTGWCVQ